MMEKQHGLYKIAGHMRFFAKNHPRLNSQTPIDLYRIRLSGGLNLVLFLDRSNHWRLSLYRANVFPSPKELTIIRRAFDIPDHATRTYQVFHSWHIIRLAWPNATQSKLFSLEPAKAID